MSKINDPFAIKEVGGEIADRSVKGFAWRAYEGSTLGDAGVGTLNRVISQIVPNVLGIICSLFFLLLGLRVVYLQGVEGKYWRNIAEDNRIRLEFTPAPRGLIYDRNGKLLAFNVPGFRLVALPAELPRDEVQRQTLLNDVLGDVPTEFLDQEALTRLSRLVYAPQLITTSLPQTLALKLMYRTAGVRGLKVEVLGEREYFGEEEFAHVLGYMGQLSDQEYQKRSSTYRTTDTIGKAGVELTYEEQLKGMPGLRQVEVDATGREQKVDASRLPVSGTSITVTIDSDLQKIAYTALKDTITNLGTKHGGSVIVMNPKNGEILALTNYPSYDPNIFTARRNNTEITRLLNDPERPLYNRAVSGVYPPGSTIKPLYAVAGLQEGVITPSTTILSTGGIRLGQKLFADWKQGGHGMVDVYKAIAESVNTYFYILGAGLGDKGGLGIAGLAKYLNLFGINTELEVDLPGERAGFIPSPEWKLAQERDRWYQGDTFNVAIGQGGLLVTPLHLAESYSAIVNNGLMPKPHLVKSYNYASGQVSPVNPESISKLNIKPDILNIVKQGMRQTVTAGSARLLNSVSIEVAGKTGTAQTGTNQPTHAWFVGYAPARDPELVVVVMVERGGEGSSTAVPIARQIFNWYAGKRDDLGNRDGTLY